MSEKTAIWHNPRCGTSRKALALLRERGIEPDVVEYLSSPPTRAEITKVLKLLGAKPRQIMRTKEPLYKELGLGDESVSDARLIDAMVGHPILIERPIVIRGSRAALGRPPEKVLEIL